MATDSGVTAIENVALPRVTIQFCTQCKWMLRAAYYAQELLSTFSTSLGEVSLQPSTGGTFVISIIHRQPEIQSIETPTSTQITQLWDRKTDGGFPETKELKRRVRDIIQPGRDLGHVDRHGTLDSGSSHEKARPSQEGEKGKTYGPACEPESTDGCENCS